MPKNSDKSKSTEKEMLDGLSKEAMKNRHKLEAGETRILANRVAYKAERVAGYIQGQNWETAIDAEKDLAMLPILLHKPAQEAEDAFDVLCSIYDEINNEKIEEYSLQRFGNVAVETSKPAVKILPAQKGNRRNLKPYYLEIATKKAKGISATELQNEYVISSSVLHHIIKSVKKTNPELFAKQKNKSCTRRDLRPFYEGMIKCKEEGKSISEIAKQFNVYPSELVYCRGQALVLLKGVFQNP